MHQVSRRKLLGLMAAAPAAALLTKLPPKVIEGEIVDPREGEGDRARRTLLSLYEHGMISQQTILRIYGLDS